MEETWKSTTGGILAIIGGVLTFFVSMGLFIASAVLNSTDRWMNDWGFNGLPVNVSPILITLGVFFLFLGILAIVGGVFALQRKVWGLALAGSIAALFPVSLFGLGSIVFIALARSEFEPKIKTPAAAAGPEKLG